MNCFLKTCLLFFLVTIAAEGQPKNPTTYPYGGVLNKSRKEKGMELNPVDFLRPADFSVATFHRTADFSAATFDNITFLEAGSKNYLSFEKAFIKGMMELSSHQRFMVDLTLANLSEGIVQFNGAAQIKILPQNFEHIRLLDTLGYMDKQYIVNHLKEKSFPGDKSAAFELDYILAKSTMYQQETFDYKPATWEDWRHWPKWAFNWFYNATMGFGYRPFRVILWALGIMVVGTLFYFFRMRKRINEYVAFNFKKEGRNDSFNKFETLVNCAYFSVMLFFTFRFKGNLLTFFDAKEKKFIIAEWLLGLAVYIAFLYHTSSVLQNIRSLFVGG